MSKTKIDKIGAIALVQDAIKNSSDTISELAKSLCILLSLCKNEGEFLQLLNNSKLIGKLAIRKTSDAIELAKIGQFILVFGEKITSWISFFDRSEVIRYLSKTDASALKQACNYWSKTIKDNKDLSEDDKREAIKTWLNSVIKEKKRGPKTKNKDKDKDKDKGEKTSVFKRLTVLNAQLLLLVGEDFKDIQITECPDVLKSITGIINTCNQLKAKVEVLDKRRNIA